jgi:hypothetical protein
MFIDSNQKIYLRYVKRIIIKSCSFLKLLKAVDIMNRHSCSLINSQNIDYQLFDLFEKFVDLASYFVTSFHISIELSCVSCSKIRVFHDASTSNDISLILIDVSIHFSTFFSLSNF